MRRCLRDKELVLLHEGDGRPADRNHLDTCARCAGRYRQLADDLRVISVVLEGDSAPVEVPRQVVWPRWVAAAAVTFALVIGLNLLFAHQWGWMATRQSSEPVAAEGATTEELIAAVEAMSAEEPPAIEGPEVTALGERGRATVEASVAELYATVADEEGCDSPAPLLDDGCDQVSAPGDAWGAGFTDLDS